MSKQQIDMSQKIALSRAEAAAMFSVSLPTLDSWMRRGYDPLPYITVGRKILISNMRAREWFDRQKSF